MVEGDDEGGGCYDFPVSIEAKEGERAEDVEMGFEAPAGEVDEQCREKSLGDGDYVACGRFSWPRVTEVDGEASDGSA